MMKYTLTIIALFWTMSLFAQIDMKDSTATVISYWNIGEKQTYKVTENELILSAEDTLFFNQEVYDATLSVLDSNTVSYLLEWKVSNYWSTQVDDIKAEIFNIKSQTPIQLLTDEYGSNISVLNWEDLKNNMDKSCDSLLVTYQELPKLLSKIKKYRNQYRSKESINEIIVKDVNQMLAFHGAKYKLGETIKARIKLPNNYGGDPLNADAIMMMDELLPQNNTYVLKFFQNVDPIQLKAVTYDYLKMLNIEGSEIPSYEDFPTVTKQIWGGTEIHSPSGWVIYSQESEQITTGKEVTTKDRLIELVK